jgi:HD superfamily phosphodiesterase
MTAARTTIAGIAIPDSALAREATECVRDASTQLLFDHSRRVFLWASLRAEQLSPRDDAELLYVGAMFHDVGLLDGPRSEHERYEIDGANAARTSSSGTACPRSRS